MALLDAFERLKELLPGVPHYFGAEHLAEHVNPPRVVWVPSRDTVEHAKRTARNPKNVLTRAAGADLWIWAISGDGSDRLENHRATEQLLNDVLALLYQEFSGSLAVNSVEWGRWQEGAWLNFGGSCVLPIQIDVPIVAPTQQTAEVKHLSLNNGGFPP
jgi:hypothetical protein